MTKNYIYEVCCFEYVLESLSPKYNHDDQGDIMNVVFSASSSIGDDFQDLLSPEYK